MSQSESFWVFVKILLGQPTLNFVIMEDGYFFLNCVFRLCACTKWRRCMSFNNLRCNLLLKFWATLLRDKLKENNKQLEKVDFKCLGIAFHLIYFIYFYQFMIFFIRFCSLKAVQFRFSKKIGPLVMNNAFSIQNCVSWVHFNLWEKQSF